MEEKAETTKLTYEQLEKAVMQLQQKLMMAENQLGSINFAAMRLTWLFKVLENKEAFSSEFISKCAKEVADILTIEEVTPETEPTEV